MKKLLIIILLVALCFSACRRREDMPLTNNTTETPVHTHSYGRWIKDQNGTTHTRSCSCGETETQQHSYDNGIVTKEPSYTSTGVKTYTCKTCGATKTEMLDKLVESSVPETIIRTYSYICNYCQHYDGTTQLTLHYCVEADIIWNCSSCGKENWNYYIIHRLGCSCVY